MNKLPAEKVLEKLKLHELWISSDGKEGELLEITGFDLSDGVITSLTHILPKIRLSDSNLRGVSFRDCILESALFDRADLTEVNLYKAELQRASLMSATLYRVNGVRATFIRADLRGANLAESDLLKAGFSYADLRGVNLTNTNLSRAVFRETDLRHAILQNANIDDAFFSGTRLFGADLRGTKGIETVRVEWIDVGEEEPIRLEGEAAREWLRQAAAKEV